jgi:hypothetical protein
MQRISLLTMASVSVIALAATFGGAYYLRAHETRKPWPKPTPPPPPSPVYHPAAESAPSAAEIEAEAATHNRRLAFEVQRALLAREPRDREAVFTFLLPELIQVEPRLVVEMVDALQPGEARDTLRTELARQWISRDRDAAIDWMKGLDADERRASAYSAARAIAAEAPEQAIYVADVFEVGDDGFIDGLLQSWARDDPREVAGWLATQPDGPRKRQRVSRVEGLLRD